MFGIRHIKAHPTTYLMAYKAGKIVQQGTGGSFFYFAPTTSLVAVPVGSRIEDFIFEPVTADFQAVTVQGQVSFRVGEPEKAAAMLNFSLAADGRSYASDDPEKLKDRVLGTIEVLTQKAVKGLALKNALLASDAVAHVVENELQRQSEIQLLGLEILRVSILAVRPTPETAKALEAEAREAILRRADEAVFSRRNAAVEQERAIRESELDTEVAVELKKRTIRETQMEAEASVQRKKHELRAANMQSDIEVETKRKEFVEINAENIRTLASAEAQKIGAITETLKGVDPKLVQALAAIGMEPSQLIAQAFGDLAENAGKIGQLNMSPDLLDSLMKPTTAKAEAARAGQR
ncbi:MAG: SPFH domain-containing protein [Betaproteobacteria bacterium]|nr:SPFH domain-containing protein [Betaproteobacteria bacterium]